MDIIQCLPPTRPITLCSLNPNYGVPKGVTGRNGHTIQGIVIQCSTKPVECVSARLKRNLPRLFSAHYDISLDGFLTEHVKPENIAWAFPEQLTAAQPDLSLFNWYLVQQNPGVALDYYTIEIVFDIQQKSPIDTLGCQDCTLTEKSSGYATLIRLIAYLAEEYNIPLDVNHIQLLQNIEQDSPEQCPCLDIVKILCAAEDYCEKPDHVSDPRYEAGNSANTRYFYVEDTSKQLRKITITELKALLGL